MNTTLYYRIILFIFGCIGIRFALVYLSKNYLDYKNIFGIFGLIIGFGFLYIYFNDLRKTGAEVFGDKIWWNNLRPIHATLYFLFSYNAINKVANAWIYLFVDVILGLISFLTYHYWIGDFKQL